MKKIQLLCNILRNLALFYVFSQFPFSHYFITGTLTVIVLGLLLFIPLTEYQIERCERFKLTFNNENRESFFVVVILSMVFWPITLFFITITLFVDTLESLIKLLKFSK